MVQYHTVLILHAVKEKSKTFGNSNRCLRQTSAQLNAYGQSLRGESNGAEPPRGLWQSPRWRQCWLRSEKRPLWRSAPRLQSFSLLFLTSWRLMEGTTMPNRPGTCFHLYLYYIKVHCFLFVLLILRLDSLFFTCGHTVLGSLFSFVLTLLRSLQFLCKFLRTLSPLSLSITHIT